MSFISSRSPAKATASESSRSMDSFKKIVFRAVESDPRDAAFRFKLDVLELVRRAALPLC